MDWQERIVADPKILAGQPTVKGTNLAVAFVLDRLADGESEAELLKAHQGLCYDDIRACLRYASQRVAPQKVFRHQQPDYRQVHSSEGAGDAGHGG